MTLKVGDIVICHGWDNTEGMKGFIEQIVSNPKLESSGVIWSGSYSIYGLQDANFSSGYRHYFGDFIGAKLEETGKSMTREDLENYAQAHFDDEMLQKDLAIIINELGNEYKSGKPRPDILKELEKFG